MREKDLTAPAPVARIANRLQTALGRESASSRFPLRKLLTFARAQPLDITMGLRDRGLGGRREMALRRVDRVFPSTIPAIGGGAGERIWTRP
jgi:hypothetical protein